MKQNVCRLLCSVCPQGGTPTPAAYSDDATNTTAIPCTVHVSVYTQTLLPGYLLSTSSFMLTLEVAA